MKVIRCDNFCRDDRLELVVVGPGLVSDVAEAIAEQRNAAEPEDSQDFYRVVEDSYVCCAGFEP